MRREAQNELAHRTRKVHAFHDSLIFRMQMSAVSFAIKPLLFLALRIHCPHVMVTVDARTVQAP